MKCIFHFRKSVLYSRCKFRRRQTYVLNPGQLSLTFVALGELLTSLNVSALVCK